MNCNEGLVTLEQLDLSNNFLSQIPVTALKVLERVRELRLSANLIQTLEGSALKGLKYLELLDLSRNRINDIPSGFFSQLTRLTHLNLAVNQLRTVNIKSFHSI